jgi:hypothetical protein
MKPNWNAAEEQAVIDLFKFSNSPLRSALEKFCQARKALASADCADVMGSVEPNAEVKARLYSGQKVAFSDFMRLLEKEAEKTSSGGPTA